MSSKKFSIIVADPPYSFNDNLNSKSSIKRGASSLYQVMDIEDIIALNVLDVVEEDALLCLWVPSSLLAEGLQIMDAWGFKQKQTLVWAKLVKSPFKKIMSKTKKLIKSCVSKKITVEEGISELQAYISSFDFNSILGFGMGHLFRQSHEIALIGTRGSITSQLKNKSQRSVIFDQNYRHSQKPEILQNQLEKMFPQSDGHSYLELFGRRLRNNWTVLGNEVCVDSSGKPEDIVDSLKNL